MTENEWSGNSRSVFVTNGDSSHSDSKRVNNDYYATDPDVVRELLKRESFSCDVIEPACGGGHISNTLEEAGYNVLSFDIVNRGYPKQEMTMDFLSWAPSRGENAKDIITNPPYSMAMEFVEHALDISGDLTKVAMLLKLTFLDSKKRKRLFDEHPPKTIYVFRNRIDCWRNGVKPKNRLKAVCYAWFVWGKGFKGDPVIKWID